MNKAQQSETLVILTPAFPGPEGDGHLVYSQQLLVRMFRRNFPELKIQVVSFYLPNRQSRYKWEDVEVISMGESKYRKWLRLFFWLKVWRELANIKKKSTIIGIISFWCGECALVGRYFGKRNRIAHLCWICGQDARSSNKLVKWIRPKPNELMAMSDFLQLEFERNHGVRPTYVIPSGIEQEAFSPMPDETRKVDLLGAGTLSPLKQYELQIELVKSLTKEFPNLKALHCGGGSEEAKLKGMIQEAGLEKNITLLGLLTHEATLQLMQQTKLFIHPSNYEGFCVACIEALYAGAHVISFVDTLRKPIPHWHVVANFQEMEQKAFELLRTPNLDHSRVFLYSMDDVARQMMNLLRYSNTDRKQ